MRHDDEAAGEDTSGPHTGNGPAENQGDRVWGHAADQTADFEEEDGEEVDQLDGEDSVHLPEEKLQGGRG